MYIYPNGNLKILHNINLNNDYDHTIYFSSVNDQTLFFSNSSKVKFDLTNQMYQRKERGWLQVNLNQNALLDCTYLMFKNNYSSTTFPGNYSDYINKWFYAFITDIEYVNENVSRIKFEIDVIQTWLFTQYCTLEPCFIEREHSATDGYFENLVDEKLDLGEEFSVQVFRRYDLHPVQIGVVYTSEVYQPTDPEEKPYIIGGATADRIGDYFTGVGVRFFDMDNTTPDDPSGLDGLDEFLHLYLDNGFENAILAIYQYPSFIRNEYLDPVTTTTWNIHGSLNFINIDGYVPKNKKLFNYPYNFLKLSDNKGSEVIYKNEYWDDLSNVGIFELAGTAYGSPIVMCYPLNYRDIAKDYENGLVYKDFNQCAWSGDAYQVWLAQNRGKMDLINKIAGGALLVGTLAVAAYTGGVHGMALGLPASAPTEIGAGYGALYSSAAHAGSMGIIASQGGIWGDRLIKGGAGALFGNIFNAVKAEKQLNATPKPAYGHTQNEILNMQMGLCGYTCYQMTIKNAHARIIDEYFSRFGYASHLIKVPNLNARQNWTYVKTIGCEINGNIASDDLTKIKEIFDNGITFWNNGNNIGNYGDFTNPVYSST